MFWKKASPSANGAERNGETVVGATSDLKGTLKTDADVRILGVFEGDIQTAGTVVIGAGGKVRADVKAKDVSIGGTIVGDIAALGRVEIIIGASVTGDIVCGSLLIDEGAVFVGKSMMRKEGEADVLLLGSGNADEPEGQKERDESEPA